MCNNLRWETFLEWEVVSERKGLVSMINPITTSQQDPKRGRNRHLFLLFKLVQIHCQVDASGLGKGRRDPSGKGRTHTSVYKL